MDVENFQVKNVALPNSLCVTFKSKMRWKNLKIQNFPRYLPERHVAKET